MDILSKSNAIKSLASSFGFDACGIAKAKELSEHATHLKSWLEKGYHADMHWMANHFEKRINPANLVEGAKSVIVVLKNYSPKEFPFEQQKLKISRYALGKDYHDVVKLKLKQLLDQINQQMGPINGRCFVDSAPVMEKSWAVEAGLGWIGRNSLLLNKSLGSYFFIGEIIIDIELSYDTPIKPFCGTCTACITACPANAIVSPSIIDSKRCISYHTIENKGEIPEIVSENMNGWVFGCDICQEACPWNKKLHSHQEVEFEPIQGMIEIKDNDWASLNESEFNIIFKNSAIKRTGYAGMMRNTSVSLNEPH